MPLYEYKCEKCAHRFEKIENHNASETKKCPKCGAKAKRQVSASAIQFKGTGWYVTDYAGKKSGAPSSEKSGDTDSSKPAEKTTETKPAEAKPAADSSEKASAKKKK